MQATLLLAAVLAITLGLAMATPASASPGQVVTTGSSGVTATQLAQALAGNGVTISNAVYTGAPDGMATFSGMSAVGFDSGIILDSGNAAQVVGPNSSDGTSTSFATPGDPQLDSLVTPNTTNDAAILDFDFVPSSNGVQFKYVFSSEEYNEFVGSFDDVFAFFVNGTNCATVNGQRVSVNTVNGGNPLGTNPSNPTLYRDNDPSDGTPTIDTQMDGLTTVLTCTATVNPGVPNHMKLAIADTSDSSLDTAVFLQLDSFVSNQPPVCPSPTIGYPYQSAVSADTGATDPNAGQALTFTVTQPPANGTVSMMGSTFTYTPNAGYEGDDSFGYSVNDGSLGCTGTVTLLQGPPPGTATIDVANPVPGSTMTVKMCCFAPGTMVDVYIVSSVVGAAPVLLGTFPADSTGTVTATVALPEGISAGSYTLKMTGTGIGGALVEESMTINVGSVVTQTPAAANVTPTTTTTQLPVTGFNGGLVLLGSALVAAGIALLRLEKRRTPA